jgi:ankyrin repeat protein
MHSWTVISRCTPLLEATKIGHTAITSRFLEAEQKTRTNDSQTALFLAARNGHEILLNNY